MHMDPLPDRAIDEFLPANRLVRYKPWHFDLDPLSPHAKIEVVNPNPNPNPNPNANPIRGPALQPV